MNAEFLHLVPNVENVRICRVCLKENDILSKNYMDINSIFVESSEKELMSYPVLTDSESGEIIQNIRDNMDYETILINKYYQELTN